MIHLVYDQSYICPYWIIKPVNDTVFIPPKLLKLRSFDEPIYFFSCYTENLQKSPKNYFIIYLPSCCSKTV